ncbi:MAG TPA: hypothetical protein VHR17_08195 [Thermoanaerobaculia bacterium]|nr:hypothetical protein [Thermoanaerobaculia bacterium]
MTRELPVHPYWCVVAALALPVALRFLFGFTGSTLTTGAVGSGCARCDPATIEPYLSGLTM